MHNQLQGHPSFPPIQQQGTRTPAKLGDTTRRLPEPTLPPALCCSFPRPLHMVMTWATIRSDCTLHPEGDGLLTALPERQASEQGQCQTHTLRGQRRPLPTMDTGRGTEAGAYFALTSPAPHRVPCQHPFTRHLPLDNFLSCSGSWRRRLSSP